jgi:hypothetical protein
MPKRWGSALKSGTIYLNPELIKAPSAYIDYVITPEICHLKHPDHGPKFRAFLQQLCPDWKRLKERLESAGWTTVPAHSRAWKKESNLSASIFLPERVLVFLHERDKVYELRITDESATGLKAKSLDVKGRQVRIRRLRGSTVE